MKALDWKYYIVYCCWIAFEFVYLYFTIIETKGEHGPLPLEEIAILFDAPTKRDIAKGRDNAHVESQEMGNTTPTMEDDKKLGVEHVEHGVAELKH
jgi:hypothetical protein